MNQIVKYDEDSLKKWRIKLQNFIKLLEGLPKKIVKHPTQHFEYVPIDALETSLNELFFGLWNWEIDEIKTVANEIIVRGTLSVFHPTAQVWIRRSGVGASQIRMKKGKPPALENKIPNALQLDAPHANAEAFKNACLTLGKHFGRGIRRDITTEFEPLVSEPTESEIEFWEFLTDMKLEDLIKNKKKIYENEKSKGKLSAKTIMQLIKKAINKMKSEADEESAANGIIKIAQIIEE